MKETKTLNKKTLLAIIATGIMSFAGILVETAMNIIFPTLMDQFKINTSTVQWMTTGYLLIIAIIVPISSYLNRRFQTKSLFLTANLLFIAGTIIDACAPTFSILLFGRMIQGVGTGIALPLMFNIILEKVPLKQMGLMMGVATLITAIAPAIGPTFGGIIASTLNWRYIFIFLLPLLMFSLVVGSLCIEQGKPTEKVKLDYTSLIFIMLTFVGIVYGFSRAGELGWTNLEVIISILVGIIGLILFICRSLKIDTPIIHLDVFKIPSFKWSVITFFIFQFLTLGLSFLLPNYTQLVLDRSALVAGLIVLPGAIIGALMAPMSGKLLDSLGAKKPIMSGSLLILLALLLYTLFGQTLSLILISVFYMVYMLGIGLSFGNTMTNGLKQVPTHLNADANAIFNTFQQFAGAIGTSIVATIVSASQAKQSVNESISYANLTVQGTLHAYIFLFILAIFSIFCIIKTFSVNKPDM